MSLYMENRYIKKTNRVISKTYRLISLTYRERLWIHSGMSWSIS